MLQNVGPVSTLENLNSCKLRLETHIIYILKNTKHFIPPWQMQLHPRLKQSPNKY